MHDSHQNVCRTWQKPTMLSSTSYSAEVLSSTHSSLASSKTSSQERNSHIFSMEVPHFETCERWLNIVMYCNCRIPGLIVSRRRHSLKNESEYNRGYSYANKWAGYSAIQPVNLLWPKMFSLLLLCSPFFQHCHSSGNLVACISDLSSKIKEFYQKLKLERTK